MITKEDLLEGIAECQGERNPNANTCQKLAALLTIYHYLYEDSDNDETEVPSYSYDPAPKNPEIIVDYYSKSDLSKAIDGKDAIQVWKIIDELMETLHLLNPKLYDGVIRKLNEL